MRSRWSARLTAPTPDFRVASGAVRSPRSVSLRARNTGAALEAQTTPEESLATVTISPVRIGPSVLARAWIVYLILGILVVAAYFVAIDPNLQDAAYNLCGASAVGAMFAGAWLWRPARLRAWMLLAVGVALQL